jgi:hypothetical protein
MYCSLQQAFEEVLLPLKASTAARTNVLVYIWSGASRLDPVTSRPEEHMAKDWTKLDVISYLIYRSEECGQGGLPSHAVRQGARPGGCAQAATG